MWKHDSKKRRYGSMLHSQLGLLKLKSTFKNVIMNCNNCLLNDYLSNGKYMSTFVPIPFVRWRNLKPGEGTHITNFNGIQLTSTTFHLAEFWFHWHVTHVHVARSSERMCNYIKEAPSFSTKCIVFSISWIFVSNMEMENLSLRNISQIINIQLDPWKILWKYYM